MTRPVRLFVRFSGVLATILGAFLPQQASAAQQCVNANAPAPLEICVQDAGVPGVWVNQPNGRQYQYYGQYSWGSAIRLGNNAGDRYHTGYFSGTLLTPVSNATTGSGAAADPYIITTVTALGTSGVRFTQRFRYVNGDRYFTKIWTVENTGTQTFNDLRFFHGGDTYFGGDDAARSWYDATLRMVYVNNSGFSNSGYMAFYANPLTPLSHYFSGHYSTGRSQVINGALNDSFNSSFLDAGYYLQWNRDELKPGESWRIEAFETWSPPGSLQVLTPGDEYVVPGATVRKTFKVHNLSDTSPLSVTLQASTTSGWNLAMPGGGSATLAPLEVIEVPVDVQVPSGAVAGDSAGIVLNVTDGALNAIAGTTRLRVPSTDYTFSTRNLDFGTASVNTQSTLSVTFTNGSSPVSVGQVGADNPLAAPFSVASDSCSNATLAAGATCVVTVRYSPVTGAEFNDSFGIPVAGEALVSETITVVGHAIDQIEVAATAGTGGTITPALSMVTAGDSVQLTVTPDEGYRIAGVQGCVGSLAGGLYTTAPVTAACSVQASFQRIVFSIGAAGGAGGSVLRSGPAVQYGESATFTITPAYGYAIGTVTGCPGTLDGDTFTTQPLTAACTLSVAFIDAISDVTVSAKGQGGGGATGLLGVGGLLLLMLRRIRRVAALAAGGIVVAGAAHAAEREVSGLHAGVSIAAATSNVSGAGITGALQSQGHSVTASLDDSRMAWRLHGGWSLHQYVTAEVGYSDLGKVSTDYTGTLPVLAVDGFMAAALRLNPRTANGFDFSLAGSYPLPMMRGLSVLARAGVFRWDAKRRVDASDGRSLVSHEDGENLLLGAGLGYAVTAHLQLTAEWTRYAMGSEHVQASGMGIRYRW
ncbi:MAG TPA: outer membrane beta-barrel protein [Steroidobacteraceae bacterium]|nr:outer membrane beta-barrel protein [Steroidobacteraceae bacterium]